ncbi:MAG: transposase, partial [Epsilonproteobacteria bacterium]|nr:transposase [Campylobacterota bacterium]
KKLIKAESSDVFSKILLRKTNIKQGKLYDEKYTFTFKMWLKILNFNSTLFLALQEQLGVFSPKEEKLIRILDFAEIEKFVLEVKITNPPKHRKEIARAFIAKSVYNLETTRYLIEWLRADRTLRLICGWRYRYQIPHESTFSRVFTLMAQTKVVSYLMFGVLALCIHQSIKVLT